MSTRPLLLTFVAMPATYLTGPPVCLSGYLTGILPPIATGMSELLS